MCKCVGRQTWERRMLPGTRRGGSPKALGPAITMLPTGAPGRGASSRPPGRTCAAIGSAAHKVTISFKQVEPFHSNYLNCS